MLPRGPSIRPMVALPVPPAAVLLDIDGVLHVGREPLPGAVDALAALRDAAPRGLRLLTNTTSASRRAIVAQLRAIGFGVADDEVLTPAALAVAHCRAHGLARVHLMVADALREDLAALDDAGPDAAVDAIVLGDLGDGFTRPRLDAAFRQLTDGAALVALQHNRYWRSAAGLALDVGAYAAALEYAAGVEATVIGKPSPVCFRAALADVGAEPADAVMVGDDVEADVGGGLGAGIPSVLVRTGKYRAAAVGASGIEPTATIDSIADLPALLAGERRTS